MNISEIQNRVLDAENLIETAIMQMEEIGVRCENCPGTRSLTQVAVIDMRVVKAFIGTIPPKFEVEFQHTKSKESTNAGN